MTNEHLMGHCMAAHRNVNGVFFCVQIDVAAIRVRESVVNAAELEGLTAQAYWLSTTLALGAFLKV